MSRRTKLRLTIEADIDIDSDEYPELTEEKIRKSVVIRESDITDGFEITTALPEYDNTVNFFLWNGVIVKKELISAQEDMNHYDDNTITMGGM